MSSETIQVGSCPCCGAMAQCIATDDPDGVPGKRWRRVRMSVDAERFQDDIGDILRALGLGDHARPISPHEVVHHEIIPAIRRLRMSRAPRGRDAYRDPNRCKRHGVPGCVACDLHIQPTASEEGHDGREQ